MNLPWIFSAHKESGVTQWDRFMCLCGTMIALLLLEFMTGLRAAAAAKDCGTVRSGSYWIRLRNMAEFKLAQWWQPKTPDERLAGGLVDSERGGLRLILDGHFKQLDTSAESVPKPDLLSVERYPILVGITVDGKLITLIDCRVTKSSGIPGLVKASLEVLPSIVAYDVHFSSASDFILRSLATRYSNLDSWVATSGFEYEFHRGEGYSVSIRYQRPEPISATLSNGATVRFVLLHLRLKHDLSIG